jgi:beta-lactam-binding protein with PASTA domain
LGGDGGGGGTETFVAVPTVTGKTEADATAAIKAANLTPVSEPVFINDTSVTQGNVVEQDPDAGKFVAEGDTVTLIVNQGPKPSSSFEPRLEVIQKDIEDNTRKLSEVLDAVSRKYPAGTKGGPGTAG